MTAATSHISPSSDYVQLYSADLQVKDKSSQSDPLPNIVFRIYIHQENDELDSVRFQISKDNELDYLYEVTYDKAEFDGMKARQALDLEFEDFPNVVRQQIIEVRQTGETDDFQRSSADSTGELKRRPFKVILTETDEGEPDEDELDEKTGGPALKQEEEDYSAEEGGKYFIVYQKLEFCRAQIFKFQFTRATPERTAEISQARYNDLTAKLKAIETDYKDAYKRIQRTNPTILKGYKLDQGVTS
jgi:phage-related protein